MAHVVLGIGTSHSPMLTLEAAQWRHRTEGDFQRKLLLADGRAVGYAELLAERGPRYRGEMAAEVFERKERACQAALDRLADALETAAPDAVLVVGDDQGELFAAGNQPAFAIFHGAEVVTTPGRYGRSEADWMRQVGRGYLMDEPHRWPGSPVLGRQLIEGLMDRDVDVAAVSEVKDPAQAGFGHAYGFVLKRLLRRPVPVVPLLLNTYYAPNVPSAARCHEIGRKLHAVLDSLPGDQRVAVVASGGLSHFVVDEAFDRGVLQALRSGDADALRATPRRALKSGTSETLNWILAAGMLEGLPIRSCEYQPLYRTEAGTGIGAAFCLWGAQAHPSSSAATKA